jgi:tRNA U34 5-methylaminomethyl-2-thiouridine-forming methyltransferase MnmC
MTIEIKTSSDGSLTLYVPELNEHYHSINGAVQESKHVFIRNGLHELQAPEIKILEIGFGTGLNALLTIADSKIEKTVYYHALELFPLEWDMVESLQYPQYLGLSNEMFSLFKAMHIAHWDEDNWIHPRFCLRKSKASLLDIELATTYNLIYFDAFAPAVQPELWTEAVFRKMFDALQEGGILVTYCAKGDVRRCMQRAGFIVERLPGPPGKREILRAKRCR